ncbi:hypothetical protein EV702DRAFT_1041974 [Suillus placidus]|uniref:Uncharacterized protein n=1 Tax=Suillus placidus TaxID=48579 RepID=A0A9P7D5W4_9AGAM|nr:hypothetical protein EV702DRAFT_1041974 [Suillus placidus]
MEMGSTDPTRKNAQQPPQMPQKLQFKTPCLKMIKKIRKARGTTHKMRLVSVVESMTLTTLWKRMESESDHRRLKKRHNHFSLMMSTLCIEAALRCILKKRSVEEEWPFWMSDGYYKAILEDRYKQLRMVWRAAQPKVTAKGSLETAAEVEERLIAKRDKKLKLVHQTTCRRNTLGDGDMSSEESDIENDIKCVLRVKNMAWRRGIERELNTIDNQRVLGDEIFTPQGSKPMKRIRASGNSMSLWSPVTGLPKALYNGEWLDCLTGGMEDESKDGLIPPPLWRRWMGWANVIQGVAMRASELAIAHFTKMYEGTGQHNPKDHSQNDGLNEHDSTDRRALRMGMMSPMSSTVQTVELIVVTKR